MLIAGFGGEWMLPDICELAEQEHPLLQGRLKWTKKPPRQAPSPTRNAAMPMKNMDSGKRGGICALALDYLPVNEAKKDGENDAEARTRFYGGSAAFQPGVPVPANTRGWED